MIKNLFLVRLDKGNGFINYYQQTTLEKLNNFIKKVGCEKLTLKDNETFLYTDYTLKEFNKKYNELKGIDEK